MAAREAAFYRAPTRKTSPISLPKRFVSLRRARASTLAADYFYPATVENYMEKTDALSAADAVALFAKQEISVSVPAAEKGGKPKRDAQTNRYIVEAQPLKAQHILGLRDLGDSVAITTVDGQKYTAAKSAKAAR